MKRSVSWSAVLLVSMGCAGIKQEDFSQEVGAAYCDLLARCGGAKSAETCKGLQAQLTQSFGLSRYEGSIAAGKVRWDEGRARGCVEAIRGLSCDSRALNPLVFSGDCQRLYEGTLAEGQACNPGECQWGTFCTGEVTGSCGGTCAKKLGEGAAATGQVQCEWGLWAIGGTCRKPFKEGEGCGLAQASESFYACGSDLYCEQTTKSCKRGKQVGESCASGDLCSGVASTCAAGVCRKPGDVGSACGSESGGCMVDLTCANTQGNGRGVCSELLNAGSACSFNSDCKPPLGCGGGTCQATVAIGQSCVQAPCGPDAFCDASAKACTAQKPNGQTCKGGNECTSGYCDFDLSSNSGTCRYESFGPHC